MTYWQFLGLWCAGWAVWVIVSIWRADRKAKRECEAYVTLARVQREEYERARKFQQWLIDVQEGRATGGPP